MIHFAFDPRSTRKTLHKADGELKAYRYGNFNYVKSDCNRDVWNPTFVYEPTTERKCGVCFKDALESELDRLRQIEVLPQQHATRWLA